MGGTDVRRAARGRQPARRLHGSVHRREDAARERPAHGRHRRDGRARLHRQVQPDHPRRRDGRRRTASSGSRARPTPWACTTTATLFEQAGLDPDSPADDVGRGPRGREDDLREDRQGRLLADDAEQHRRLAARRGDGRPRRPHAGATTATAPTRRRSTTTPRRRSSSSCTTSRWEDNSFGSNFLLDWGTINQEFAAGNIGMYTVGLRRLHGARARLRRSTPTSYGLTVVPVEGTTAARSAAATSPS